MPPFPRSCTTRFRVPFFNGRTDHQKSNGDGGGGGLLELAFFPHPLPVHEFFSGSRPLHNFFLDTIFFCRNLYINASPREVAKIKGSWFINPLSWL